MSGTGPEHIGHRNGQSTESPGDCLTARSRVYCEGTVEAVHTHLAPALRFEADLRDGSGQLMLRLRFVGCERVPGIVAGARVRIDGVILREQGVAIVLNPIYELC